MTDSPTVDLGAMTYSRPRRSAMDRIGTEPRATRLTGVQQAGGGAPGHERGHPAPLEPEAVAPSHAEPAVDDPAGRAEVVGHAQHQLGRRKVGGARA